MATTRCARFVIQRPKQNNNMKNLFNQSDVSEMLRSLIKKAASQY